MMTGTFPIAITGGGTFDDDKISITHSSTGGFYIFIGDEVFKESDVSEYEVLREEVTPAKSYYDGLHGLIGMFAFGPLGFLFGYRVKNSKKSGSFFISFKDGRSLCADYKR